jgi:hypothetical protein
VTFTVSVDWNRNGTFTDTGDDVTTVVRGGISATYGRDQSTALSPVVAGRGGFTLDNSTRTYSPRNASSPLFGLVKPSRPVLIQRTISATTYTIFRGHTDDSPLDPDADAKTVAFTLIDYLADFRGVKVTTALNQGIRTGAAIDAVLTAAGWTGGRAIDTGATILPWWWADGDDAFDMLQQLLAAEGPPSLLTIDASGAFVFRDRHHRVTSTASTVSQATFTGSGTSEPVMGRGFKYSEPWSNIVNDVQITVDERQPSGALSAVIRRRRVSVGPVPERRRPRSRRRLQPRLRVDHVGDAVPHIRGVDVDHPDRGRGGRAGDRSAVAGVERPRGPVPDRHRVR